jgi:hypothetical protein
VTPSKTGAAAEPARRGAAVNLLLRPTSTADGQARSRRGPRRGFASWKPNCIRPRATEDSIVKALTIVPLAIGLAACQGQPPDIDTGQLGPSRSWLENMTPRTPLADPLAGRKDVAEPPPAADLVKFMAWGDSRPDNDPVNFEKDYEMRLLPFMKKIFNHAFANNCQFVLGSGDYINAYMPAADKPGIYDTIAKWEAGAVKQYGWMLEVADIFRKKGRPVYFGLGNHEALGWTDLNSTTFDETPNMREYMKMMIPGLKPWYSFTMNFKKVTDTTKTLTAKFVFIAPNAWNNEQAAWLRRIMGTSTNYTFVIRHEANDKHGCDAPGLAEQQGIIKGRYTLLIQGHEHEYRRAKGSNEMVAGNGGAQKNTDNMNLFYGYVSVEQDPMKKDDRLLVKAWDAINNIECDSFKVAPNGAVTEEARRCGL